MRRTMLLSAVLGLVATAWVTAAPPTITTESLLAEMTDLRDMAEFPDPPYTCKQFSSYDRESKTPADPKGWFANADVGKYLRVEDRDGRKEHVMVDTDGPGAIVRIWSANPEGVLRVYLDNSEKPAIEAPMKEMLGGTMPGIPKPIACEVSRGWNSYLPIPYAKHCKITSDKGGFYYHVNYRTYPADTQVVSFEPEQLKTLAPKIADVARRLASPRSGGGPPETRQRTPFELTIEPGQSAPLSIRQAGRAICGILVKATAKDVVQALRGVVMRIEFDGHETVASPLGDFFGAAPGINPYESLPMGVTKDGDMWSHWYMPFRETAVVTFANMGTQPVTLTGGVSTVPYRWTDRTLYFHAKWRMDRQVPTRPMQDWNYLTAKGEGVFAGVAFNIANPVKAWWGEGDEKIYVDGETFPSHFGTGTEDYYGYAWCCNELFTHAYHNQPRCDGPGNYGHTSVNRWHILDRIPFTKDFRFDMELWHWHEKCEVDMAVTAYWYATAAAEDTFPKIEKADLPVTVLPKWEPPKVKGAIEGESMRVIEKAGGLALPQDIGECSGERHMFWHGELKVGDRLVLGFPVEKAGKYEVRARFLTAGDYGIVQLAVNGEKAGEPRDFYHNGIKVSDEISLGTFELKAGENTISAEATGTNEKAKPAHFFGLDYVLLKPAP